MSESARWIAATVGPEPSAAASSACTSLSGTATSPTTRLRIRSARESRLCSSVSSKPSDNDSAIICDSSTVETVFSNSVFASTRNARKIVRANQS